MYIVCVIVQENKDNSFLIQINNDDVITEKTPSIKLTEDINYLVKNVAETENTLENKFDLINIQDANVESNTCENNDQFEIFILNNKQLEKKYISF